MSKPKKKKLDTRGFVIGRGYNSLKTGNFYNFLGVDSDGWFHFYRRFNHDWCRISARESQNIFDVRCGQVDSEFGEDGENELDLDQYISGRI